MKKFMTKKEAVAEFKELVLPIIKQHEKMGSGRVDEPMRAEAWNNYTDGLCKDGKISMRQYESWTNPF